MQRLLLRLASLAVHAYYRFRRLGGGVPRRGPVLLVGNHPNGLVDPIALADTTPRTVRFLGKAPIFDMPVLGTIARRMRALPVYRAMDGADTTRNEDTFGAVVEALRRGDVVCLFPEGRSHSEPHLLELRTGTARMALRTEASCGFELGVRVVPVGLVYRSKRRFRSRAATWVGEPIDVRELAETFRADERQAVLELNERIAEGLREVTLGLDRWEDLPLLELAERIWRAEGDTESRTTRTKRYADGVRVLRERDPARIDELAHRVACFRDRLERLGLSVGYLDVRYGRAIVVRFVLRTLLDLLLGMPLALAGIVLWFLPYHTVRLVGRRIHPNPDMAATVHLLAGLVLFPLWLLGIGVATGLWLGWPSGVLAMLLAPVLGLLALSFLEWWRGTVGDVSAFLRIGHRRRLRVLLGRQRDELATEIEALASELREAGPA